jgi:hypothetical protein
MKPQDPPLPKAALQKRPKVFKEYSPMVKENEILNVKISGELKSQIPAPMSAFVKAAIAEKLQRCGTADPLGIAPDLRTALEIAMAQVQVLKQAIARVEK